MSKTIILFDGETAKSVCGFINTFYCRNMTAGIHCFSPERGQRKHLYAHNTYEVRMVDEYGIIAMESRSQSLTYSKRASYTE